LTDGAIRRPPGLRLDLGGVAKGWTASRALEAVPGTACIDAGGDIALRGAWGVAVEHDGRPVAHLTLEDCGVATSGIDRRRWSDGHHIIDPSTQRPAVTDVLAATVVASTTASAEAIARTIVVLGAWDGLGWAESVDDVRGALLTTSAGATISIARTKEVLG
ncbi:MAG TPA: FAD:protein FMN transferase, partial [Actinomycetota bacterium]|nr:FAD:protein FMN transferase [Actinomycetota bacterium]